MASQKHDGALRTPPPFPSSLAGGLKSAETQSLCYFSALEEAYLTFLWKWGREEA